jgi:hypothetical protein
MIVNSLYPNVWRILARALSQVAVPYSGKVFFNVAPADIAYPYLIYQSDSSLGIAYPMLNASAWKGLVTLRSVSTSMADATDSLASLLNSLNEPISISGINNIPITYHVQLYPYKTYSFPVDQLNNRAVYTSAVGVETYITPAE